MLKLVRRFRADTQGAVTIDWVVLTAGIVALGAGAGSIIFDGSSGLAEAISSQLSADEGASGGAGGGTPSE